MDDVEVRELRYFIAVAEELNFTHAARRLGIAQPPLSTAVAKLERKLGVVLLERTSRRVALTPAGALLLEQGRIALAGFGAALERTRRRGADAGRLAVAVKAGGGTGLLKEITRRYARDPRLPGVHVVFGDDGGPCAALRRGAADVAILRTPFDRHGLDTEVLLVEPRVAVLPADHRLAGRRELCRADLAGEPMPRWAGPVDAATAAYWSGDDTAPAASGAAGPYDGTPVGDMNQLLDVVALGHAVAYVPASIARPRGGADLAVVPVRDLSPSEVVVAWPETSRSRAVAAFVEAAAEAAASRPEQAASFA